MLYLQVPKYTAIGIYLYISILPILHYVYLYLCIWIFNYNRHFSTYWILQLKFVLGMSLFVISPSKVLLLKNYNQINVIKYPLLKC